MATEIEPTLEKSAAAEVEKEERKIPVFTVLKKNSILKNIFLIDTPPPPPPPPPPPHPLPLTSSSSNSAIRNEELEEILVVGRHPGCTIMLEHPSISRFHLRIHSIPSIQSLSVFDLSSAHGTWVSGQKIEPGIRIQLHEGDTLQLGRSTRLYRLHWVPLNLAYDMKNPFVPPLDESEPVEDREEETYAHQDKDCLYVQEDQTESRGDYFEGLNLLFADMTMMSSMKQLSPSAPLMPEDMKSPCSFEENAENKIPFGEAVQQSEIVEMHSVWGPDKGNSNLQGDFASPVAQKFSQAENPASPPLTSQVRSGMSIWERRDKSASVNIQIGIDREYCTKAHNHLEMESESNGSIRSGSISEGLFAAADWIEEALTPDKENCTPDTLLNRPSKKIDQEKMKYESSMNSLLSSMNGEGKEAFTPDKENITPKTHLLRSLKKMGKLEEMNQPKTYRSSPLKSAGSVIRNEFDMLVLSNNHNQLMKLLQEKKSVNPAPSSQARPEVDVLKVQGDRVPFQPLLMNSNKTKSHASSPRGTIRGSNSVNDPQIKEAIQPFHSSSEEIKTWTMVVDRTCLLNKESRKALQLMQGLPGTSLIIPRIVIRELDCMKRHNDFFRRKTEVYSALQWIEDCMVNSKWWVHVQNSVEDVRPIAPTPRDLPLSQLSEEKENFSFGSIPFSPCGSFLDIVSPTSEDHVLECAIFFRTIRNHGQLVLLSNDVTLKIKAMAEGLCCETAEEFRESLVNPFSERFLWTDSSPRGHTWSGLDDVVLREKYYNGPSRKQSKSGEAAKGLKLILLHNSHYRQISSVS